MFRKLETCTLDDTKHPSNTYLAGFCLLIMMGLFLSSRTRLLGVAGDFEGILSVLLVEVAAGLEVLEPRGGSGGLRGLKMSRRCYLALMTLSITLTNYVLLLN